MTESQYRLASHLNLSKLTRREAFQTTTSRKVRNAALHIAFNLTGKMLDVGCGNGLFMLEFYATVSKQNSLLFGIDYDKQAILEAKELLSDNKIDDSYLIIGDAFQMPFPENYFKAVFCLNTLMNIVPFNRIEMLLTEIHRVCCPGGLMIFDYRNAYNPYLSLSYFYHSITHQFITQGHKASQFASLKSKLKIKSEKRITITSPIPGLPLAYLNIWEK